MSLQLDYYKALLSSDAGQRVLFDLEQTAFEWGNEHGSDPAVQAALNDFVTEIYNKCGLTSAEARMDIIKQKASIAASLLDKPQALEKQDKNLLE